MVKEFEVYNPKKTGAVPLDPVSNKPFQKGAAAPIPSVNPNEKGTAIELGDNKPFAWVLSHSKLGSLMIGEKPVEMPSFKMEGPAPAPQPRITPQGPAPVPMPGFQNGSADLKDSVLAKFGNLTEWGHNNPVNSIPKFDLKGGKAPEGRS